jgi:hypothetical protein
LGNDGANHLARHTDPQIALGINLPGQNAALPFFLLADDDPAHLLLGIVAVHDLHLAHAATAVAATHWNSLSPQLLHRLEHVIFLTATKGFASVLDRDFE